MRFSNNEHQPDSLVHLHHNVTPMVNLRRFNVGMLLDIVGVWTMMDESWKEPELKANNQTVLLVSKISFSLVIYETKKSSKMFIQYPEIFSKKR